MRRRRALLAASLPVLAIALAWLRQEEPALWREGLSVAALALTPTLVSRWLWRSALALAAAVLTVWVGVGAAPWALVPGTEAPWLDPLADALSRGLGDYYEVVLPFEPDERPEMHAVLLLALLVCGLAVSALVCADRPVLAGLALAAGMAWPATPVAGRGALALGALALAAFVWVLVVARTRTVGAALPGLAAGAVVVAVATVASTSDAVARDAVLDWRGWDFYDAGGSRVGVRYVWDASYGGIAFPDKRTTVLRVRAPRRSTYWRASTLDSFGRHRWFESPYLLATGPPRGRIPRDPLLPPAAERRSEWLRQDVEIAALEDDHLIAAATPVALRSASIGDVLYLSSALLRAAHGLERGHRYSVWSYVPRPDPRALVRSRPRYPADATRYLELDRATLQPFGAPGRTREVDALFTDDRYFALWAYRPLWREAQRLAADGRSPYEVTLAVERWLRTRGGFRYEEQPPRPVDLPPLVDFVVRSKAGYCQHFAGAMTMMLRFLGIPARVAVGFTSGRWEDGVWTVSDHEAHAWVEAWFDGFGWLPFDPTPGRGTLSAIYTTASDSAEAARLLNGGRLPDLGSLGATGRLAGRSGAIRAEDRGGVPWIAPVSGVAAGALAALGLAKLVRRRLRYLRSDPRRVASATHAELLDWLRDQGLATGPSSTLHELARTIERELGVSVRAYTRAAGRARYGPPDAAAAAAAEARRELRRVLGVLRARLGRGRRLRGYASLASLRRTGAT